MIARRGPVAARVVLTVLCALGVVAMHQMAAAADPPNATASHAMHMTDVATAHHEGPRTQVRGPDACIGHETCQGLPSTSRVLPAPSLSLLVFDDADPAVAVLPLPSVDPHGGDPPDLNVLSVART